MICFLLVRGMGLYKKLKYFFLKKKKRKKKEDGWMDG
jgi:hypothetical protein